MKIVILPSALEDLADGFHFYEKQDGGLGGYFLESLYSNVDSLRLYAGIHRKILGFHRLLSKRFPLLFTTIRLNGQFACGRFWIAAGIRVRFGVG